MKEFTDVGIKYYYLQIVRPYYNHDIRIYKHLIDSLATEQAERLLRRQIRIEHWREQKDTRILYAILYNYAPAVRQTGPIVKYWSKEDITALAPKTQSKKRWYYAIAVVNNKHNERFERSASFPANSDDEAVTKAQEWLKQVAKGCRRKERIVDAGLRYANRYRPDCKLPKLEI